MAEEVRCIVFSSEEVLAALSAVMRQRGDEAPGDGAPTLVLSRDGKGRPIAMIAYVMARPACEFSFTNQELMAALVHYCMQSAIPLARRASKMLDIENDRLALFLTSANATESAAGQEPRAPGTRPHQQSLTGS
ncbi:MAG: hypothetical protein ACOY99_11630 [Pseudomonadota bacterium]